MAIDNQPSDKSSLMLFNIYSHLLAFTRIYSHFKLIITARTKFPRGFLHIELKVILDLGYYSVFGTNLIMYGESEIHATSVSSQEAVFAHSRMQR